MSLTCTSRSLDESLEWEKFNCQKRQKFALKIYCIMLLSSLVIVNTYKLSELAKTFSNTDETMIEMKPNKKNSNKSKWESLSTHSMRLTFVKMHDELFAICFRLKNRNKNPYHYESISCFIFFDYDDDECSMDIKRNLSHKWSVSAHFTNASTFMC